MLPRDVARTTGPRDVARTTAPPPAASAAAGAAAAFAVASRSPFGPAAAALGAAAANDCADMLPTRRLSWWRRAELPERSKGGTIGELARTSCQLLLAGSGVSSPGHWGEGVCAEVSSGWKSSSVPSAIGGESERQDIECGSRTGDPDGLRPFLRRRLDVGSMAAAEASWSSFVFCTAPWKLSHWASCTNSQTDCGAEDILLSAAPLLRLSKEPCFSSSCAEALRPLGEVLRSSRPRACAMRTRRLGELLAVELRPPAVEATLPRRLLPRRAIGPPVSAASPKAKSRSKRPPKLMLRMLPEARLIVSQVSATDSQSRMLSTALTLPWLMAHWKLATKEARGSAEVPLPCAAERAVVDESDVRPGSSGAEARRRAKPPPRPPPPPLLPRSERPMGKLSGGTPTIMACCVCPPFAAACAAAASPDINGPPPGAIVGDATEGEALRTQPEAPWV
mmetsp:Transcript_60724/g.198830  ORF Transcript_60724/g.198830 Transcript_60724/m.198830 type:complete len:451 (+) Transcript_60724:694-2046(+)